MSGSMLRMRAGLEVVAAGVDQRQLRARAALAQLREQILQVHQRLALAGRITDAHQVGVAGAEKAPSSSACPCRRGRPPPGARRDPPRRRGRRRPSSCRRRGRPAPCRRWPRSARPWRSSCRASSQHAHVGETGGLVEQQLGELLDVVLGVFERRKGRVLVFGDADEQGVLLAPGRAGADSADNDAESVRPARSSTRAKTRSMGFPPSEMNAPALHVGRRWVGKLRRAGRLSSRSGRGAVVTRVTAGSCQSIQ